MSRKYWSILFLIICFPVVFVFGCETKEDDNAEYDFDGKDLFNGLKDKPIQEIVAQTFVLQDFESLLVATQLSQEVLKSPPYTFFAPWNFSFRKKPKNAF